jgi:hypothetical protein
MSSDRASTCPDAGFRSGASPDPLGATSFTWDAASVTQEVSASTLDARPDALAGTSSILDAASDSEEGTRFTLDAASDAFQT